MSISNSTNKSYDLHHIYLAKKKGKHPGHGKKKKKKKNCFP
jgi:hypothetical protein